MLNVSRISCRLLYDNIARSDLRFNLIDKFGIHQLVGTGIDNDAIFPGLVENNKPGSGCHSRGLLEELGVDTFRSIQVGRNFAELVPADDPRVIGLGPQASDANGLV